MNLGSARKWVELLGHDGLVLNDGWGLRWADGSFSPVGVLENFITNEWKEDAVQGFMNVDGNVLIPSRECLKRIKAKTQLGDVDDQAPHGVEAVCAFIEANYAWL